MTKTTAQLPLTATTPSPEVSLEDLSNLADRVDAKLEAYRNAVWSPSAAKVSPTFTLPQVAKLCGLSDDTMLRRVTLAAERGLPPGTIPESEANRARPRRVFSQAEAVEWIRAEGVPYVRTEPQKACVIAVGIFKGGVGKTTTAVCMAQGLALKGYRVLVVDLDPQGSATTLLGMTPRDVDAANTFLPLAIDPNSSAEQAVEASDTLAPLPTYWAGVDLVPANVHLFSAEFLLPLRQSQRVAGDSFMFMDVLNQALNKSGARDTYDFVIIDTPPSLSYVTMNAYWAADSIVMPIPPEGLDIASSGEFLGLLKDLTAAAQALFPNPKAYHWIRAVPSRVDASAVRTRYALEYLADAYQAFLSKTEIPETGVARNAGMEYRTPYDIAKYVGDNRTYLRARDAYDKLVDEIEHLTRSKVWGETIAE